MSVELDLATRSRDAIASCLAHGRIDSHVRAELERAWAYEVARIAKLEGKA